MIADFQIPEATDEHDRKLLSDVENVGWHVIHISEDESGPQYTFSVGLYFTFGHPEILVMGLSQEVAHQLINLAASLIEKGKTFQPRERTNNLTEGFECSIVPISLEHYKEYLGYDIWFYRSLKQSFPALQLVWPDKQGCFPWDKNYDQRFFSLQRLLDVT